MGAAVVTETGDPAIAWPSERIGASIWAGLWTCYRHPTHLPKHLVGDGQYSPGITVEPWWDPVPVLHRELLTLDQEPHLDSWHPVAVTSNDNFLVNVYTLAERRMRLPTPGVCGKAGDWLGGD